ncbi:MAG TPA: hypothetical protein VM369_08870 [Candidatus Binatia bacterium]|nr:hypothetical protein [Candidatus Binatia bacterium]
MKLSQALALAALMGTACAVQAETAKPANSGARPDDVVCTYEKTTGSHLGRRVCATRAAREQRAKENQEAMTALRRGNNGGSGGGSSPGGR